MDCRSHSYTAPFRFCLNPDCGVAYSARQRSDIYKLSTIGTTAGARPPLFCTGHHPEAEG